MTEPAPAASMIEQVASRWVLELLGLPATCSVGFVTGAQMATTVGLAAARTHVLAAHDWDAEADGLAGAPPVRVVVGGERHSTIDRGLRFIGLGSRAIRVVDVDDAGRMLPKALEAVLTNLSGPTIVCAQVGNVNGGAIDPIGPIADIVEQRDSDDIWLHVDGAFGLWARAVPSRRLLLAGVERADSWATDAHKWLNVPYDCGIVDLRPPQGAPAGDDGPCRLLAGRRRGEPPQPDGLQPRVLQACPVRAGLGRAPPARGRRSRGARWSGAVSWPSVSRALSARQTVSTSCTRTSIRSSSGSGPAAGEDDDDHTRHVVDEVQREGTCLPSATVWHGCAAMRISVCNWRTDEDDVDRSVRAILAAHSGARGRPCAKTDQ